MIGHYTTGAKLVKGNYIYLIKFVEKCKITKDNPCLMQCNVYRYRKIFDFSYKIMGKKLYIGVIGGTQPEDKYRKIAYDVGIKLAENKAIVICGGLSGIMEEVSHGVRDGDGTVMGILPGDMRGNENGYLSYSITTGIGYARNFLVVRASEALIAIDGSNGTLSEGSFAISEGRDVVGIDSHVLKKTKPHEGDYYPVNSADEAVSLALECAEKFIRKHS